MDRRVTRRAPTAAIAAILAAMLILTLASPAAAYRRGEYVTISGRVTDLDGAPLAGVTVLFEPSRRVFKLFQRKRNREQTDRLQIPTETDARGDYSFEWRWDGFYDTFELAIAVPLESGGQKSYDVLHRTDFTDRMMDGSPVVVELEVEDTSRLSLPGQSPRPYPPGSYSPGPSSPGPHSPPATGSAPRAPDSSAAPGGATTDDERRILDEMGQPDQIDSHQRLAGTETSWWYFEDGKVYHFMNGELSQVMHFDPIPAAPDG